nr:protein kinase [uncultured Holophaga sp.]
MRLTAGTRLGPYVIQEPLGAGGMGEVYRAHDSRLGRSVAIKVLIAAFASEEERLLRFEREARTLAQLNSPAIVQIHDTGLHEGRPYLVMEYLEGTTLRMRIKEGSLPARRAAEIALQIARGLAVAHEKGLIHRDLKPENIFLKQDGQVKILDFGLAKFRAPVSGELDLTQDGAAAELETRTGVVVGTVGYMSPEQISARPVDPRSDIFSLGVILWEMLGGERPFQGASAIETLHAILKMEPDPLKLGPGVPLSLERTLLRCLQKEPQLRFQSAADLAFDLEHSATQASGTLLQRPSPWRERLARGIRPALWGLGIALLLGLVAVIGYSSHPQSTLSLQHLTYQNDIIGSARFAGDGKSFIFSLEKGMGSSQLMIGRIDGTDLRPLAAPGGARILSVSSRGDMALLLPGGTLAQASLAGSPPRLLLEQVQEADWSPDGRELAVVRMLEDGRKRLEYPIGHPLFETEGGVPPLSHARISPDGRWVAFIHYPSASRGELCLSDREGHRRLLFQGTPDSLAWAPDGRTLLFTCKLHKDSYEVRSIDLKGRHRLLYPLTGLMTILDVSSEGQVLLQEKDVRMGLRCWRSGETGERDMAWLQTSSVADLSRDGRQVLFGEKHEGPGPGGAYLRTMEGSSPLRLGDGDPITLSPDGKWALVAGMEGGKGWSLLPTGAGSPRKLALEGLQPEWGVFLPGSPYLLLGAVGHKGFSYYRLDLDTGTCREWGEDPVDSAFCLASPDGLRVALGPVNGALELRDREGARLRTIPGLKAGDQLLQWHADGRHLFIADADPAIPRILLFDLATGRRTPWKALAPPDAKGIKRFNYIAVAPRGDAYAYSYTRVINSDLYLMSGALKN